MVKVVQHAATGHKAAEDDRQAKLMGFGSFRKQENHGGGPQPPGQGQGCGVPSSPGDGFRRNAITTVELNDQAVTPGRQQQHGRQPCHDDRGRRQPPEQAGDSRRT